MRNKFFQWASLVLLITLFSSPILMAEEEEAAETVLMTPRASLYRGEIYSPRHRVVMVVPDGWIYDPDTTWEVTSRNPDKNWVFLVRRAQEPFKHYFLLTLMPGTLPFGFDDPEFSEDDFLTSIQRRGMYPRRLTKIRVGEHRALRYEYGFSEQPAAEDPYMLAALIDVGGKFYNYQLHTTYGEYMNNMEAFVRTLLSLEFNQDRDIVAGKPVAPEKKGWRKFLPSFGRNRGNADEDSMPPAREQSSFERNQRWGR